MIEEDEGELYVEFFSKSIGISLFLSLFLAPMVPGKYSEWFLVFAIGLGLLSSFVFSVARWRILKLAAKRPIGAMAQAIISDDSRIMFRVVGSTSAILVFAVAWLGATGILWLLQSFFVLFAGIHIATSILYTFLTLADIRAEINDIAN